LSSAGCTSTNSERCNASRILPVSFVNDLILQITTVKKSDQRRRTLGGIVLLVKTQYVMDANPSIFILQALQKGISTVITISKVEFQLSPQLLHTAQRAELSCKVQLCTLMCHILYSHGSRTYVTYISRWNHILSTINFA
jgi:hypothetical protein